MAIVVSIVRPKMVKKIHFLLFGLRVCFRKVFDVSLCKLNHSTERLDGPIINNDIHSGTSPRIIFFFRRLSKSERMKRTNTLWRLEGEHLMGYLLYIIVNMNEDKCYFNDDKILLEFAENFIIIHSKKKN